MKIHLVRSLSLTASLFMMVHGMQGQDRRVNFEFAPVHYLSAIGFPDDWQKTLATETGSLAYDFGPGPYARPLTEISIGVTDDTLRVLRQRLEDPLAPIMTTMLEGNRTSIRLETFSIPANKDLLNLPKTLTDRVERIGGWNGAYGWANPLGTVDPAFRNVAWGNNRAILYRVGVPAGSKNLVALGLCEPYKPRPGTRLLELRVEGAEPLTVDPLEDGTQNKPLVRLFHGEDINGDGKLSVEVHPTIKSPDPNVFLNVIWVFPEGMNIREEGLIRGQYSSSAEVYYDCGRDLELAAPEPRLDALQATFTSSDVQPVIVVRTRRQLTFDGSTGRVLADGLPYILSRPGMASAEKTRDGWKFVLPRGITQAELIVVHGLKGRDAVTKVPDLSAARAEALKYWQTNAIVPRSTITVADPAIQYLVDASVRNMFQIRERVDGKIQYQPGPTVYRGLWLGDVLLTGAAVLAAGDTASVREYLEAAFPFQRPNGHVRVMVPNLSLTETPIYIAGMCFYARSTGNMDWLRRNWKVVQKAVRWIEDARNQTLADPSSPHFGLMPQGFVDGGIAEPMSDYGSVWWAMAALEHASWAARWLGNGEEADEWSSLFGKFSVAFEKAASRDLQHDPQGRLFLPVGIGQRKPKIPQLGQYGLLFAFKYGKFFHHPSPLLDRVLESNLALLDANSKQGLAVSTGWLYNGVWPWMGGIHGMTHLLRGNREKALDLLYAYANHASPVGTWVEEQLTKDIGPGTTGDVSNAEASAVFVHFIRNLLAQEKGNDLELLAGIPGAWMRPGSKNELRNSFTEFGPVSLTLSVSEIGNSATLQCSPVDGRNSPGRLLLHLSTLKQLGFKLEGGKELPDTWEGKWNQPIDIRLSKSH